MAEVSMEKKDNIVFIGIMASGKTTFGKKIAKAFDINFIDTDQEIERITGMTIPEIFKKEGELRFRSEETLALKRIAHDTPAVISTGGGIVLKKENRDLIKDLGIVVYLDAHTDIIAERVSRNQNRPLLKSGDIKEKVKKLSEERKKYYLEIADIIIDTGSDRFDNIANKIEREIRNFQKKNKQGGLS
jgi:shikimate kinase